MSLNKKMNFFLAALLSSIIFASMHLYFSHLLIYTSMGFVFAFLYVKTKRIIVPIVVHMSLNSFAVIGQLLLGPEEVDRLRQELFLIIFRSEEHTSELQSRGHLVCRLLLEKKKITKR